MGQHLTVYHIKDEFAEKCGDSFESLLRSPGGKEEKEEKRLVTIDLAKEMPFKAQLFISIPEPTSPSWVAFLEEGFGKLPVPNTQSIGAVLFVRIPYKDKKKEEEKEELFAFTFGGGRHLLESDSYEKKYGLRVALNVIYDYAGGAIEPDRLKSVAATTRAANTIRTRKQTDRRASFEIFGVDTQHDDLDAVAGTPPVKSGFWSSLLSGSESLGSTPGVDLKGLGDYCQDIADKYRELTYKSPFGWIDNQREITEPGEIEKLEKEIVRTLIKDPEKIILAVPEIIDWEQVDHFTFSFDKKEFPDPGGVDLIKALKKIEGLENEIKELSKKIEKDFDFDEEDLERVKRIIESLKQERLIAEDNQGHEEVGWSLRNCLSGEIEYEKRTYILSEGRIYEIRADFLQEINDFVGSLPFKEEAFLPCCSAGKNEGDYNEDTAKDDESLLLLDKKTVGIAGRTTPIEICDLLKTDQENKKCRFIHVKRKLNSSSLSHLFAQGSVSADLFWRSRDYRKEVLQKIEGEEKVKTLPAKAPGPTTYVGDFSSLFTDIINPPKTEVLYAIIADWKNRSLVDALPFFSKVNLRRHINYLRLIGYEVSIVRINFV